MKRLIVLALLAAAIWYGWKHYPDLIKRHPSHEAVIENQTGGEMDRIRLKVGDQTLVAEKLANDERARCSRSASITTPRSSSPGRTRAGSARGPAAWSRPDRWSTPRVRDRFGRASALPGGEQVVEAFTPDAVVAVPRRWLPVARSSRSRCAGTARGAR